MQNLEYKSFTAAEIRLKDPVTIALDILQFKYTKLDQIDHYKIAGEFAFDMQAEVNKPGVDTSFFAMGYSTRPIEDVGAAGLGYFTCGTPKPLADFLISAITREKPRVLMSESGALYRVVAKEIKVKGKAAVTNSISWGEIWLPTNARALSDAKIEEMLKSHVTQAGVVLTPGIKRLEEKETGMSKHKIRFELELTPRFDPLKLNRIYHIKLNEDVCELRMSRAFCEEHGVHLKCLKFTSTRTIPRGMMYWTQQNICSCASDAGPSTAAAKRTVREAKDAYQRRQAKRAMSSKDATGDPFAD
jgi:hypothetical protein